MESDYIIPEEIDQRQRVTCDVRAALTCGLIALALIFLSTCSSDARVNDDDDQFPVWSPDGGQIVFESSRDASSLADGTDIYIIDEDGSDPRHLIHIGDWAMSVSWSPDGKWLAFSCCGKISIIAVDGTKLQELPVDDNSFHPVWSPDGRQIAFELSTIDYDAQMQYSDISIMDADGSNLHILTNRTTHSHNPVWSPSGTQIAYESYVNYTWAIYVMAVDGSNARRLTQTDDCATSPTWSPDGQQIAFVSERDGSMEIYIVTADGSNPRKLTNGGDFAPAWSPDGRQIAFVSARDGNREIYIIDVNGNNIRNLTQNSAEDYAPTWSPSGDQIAFVSERDGSMEIYIVTADGSNVRRLT